jgi:UDP-N-acetylglucosamine 4,6-dehydratase
MAEPRAAAEDPLAYVRGKTVLVTGAAGTVGGAIARKLAGVARAVRCFDHAETELFYLGEELRGKGHITCPLGDVRDLDRLRFAMNGVQVVFHAAALKHVGLGEYNPFEVVQTNLVGLDNVIRASLDVGVDRVVFTSSDKAVNPTNVMGASKMMGERIMGAANEIRGLRQTRFASVRFGNVIGSRGSVVPIFARQLLRNEPLLITDQAMTRYVMTVDEAASLVVEAGALAHGGEVFVTKMRALSVVDLAQAMANRLSAGKWSSTQTGPRPGEKLYEELLTNEERERTVEVERLLIVLPPAGAQFDGKPTPSTFAGGVKVTKPWSSAEDTLMTIAEIEAYLAEHRILEPYLSVAGTA